MMWIYYSVVTQHEKALFEHVFMSINAKCQKTNQFGTVKSESSEQIKKNNKKNRVEQNKNKI